MNRELILNIATICVVIFFGIMVFFEIVHAQHMAERDWVYAKCEDANGIVKDMGHYWSGLHYEEDVQCSKPIPPLQLLN